MDFSMLHPADQLVMIMDRIYHYGMTTTSGGNLSIRDAEGTVWITPTSTDKGNMRREDIIQIHPDGSMEGIHKPSVEYPFHVGIYKARPDLGAIVHAHPPELVAFSLTGRLPDTSLIPNAEQLCTPVAWTDYALPGSQKLGGIMTEAFAKGANSVLLANHGVATGGKDLFSAFMAFETLEYCARLQINSSIIGKPHGLTRKQLDFYKQRSYPTLEEFEVKSRTNKELGLRRDMCKFIKRAYDNHLFTSSQGTFSCRLDDDSFLITPYLKDRNYIQPEDMAVICKGKKEKGSTPSRSVLMHKYLYDTNPDIECIIIAHPPYIMGFGCADVDFTARLIPESYMVLRDVKRVPFGLTLMEPHQVAGEISLKTPAVIAENECVIVVGTSLLNAFDKLEVMEYSAKAVIDATSLGSSLVKITEEQVSELIDAFHLS